MKHQKNNDLLLLTIKSIEQTRDASNAKECYNSYLKNKKKQNKIGEMIKNKYSATKNYRKPKHWWHKISYYRTPKNFT